MRNRKTSHVSKITYDVIMVYYERSALTPEPALLTKVGSGNILDHIKNTISMTLFRIQVT